MEVIKYDNALKGKNSDKCKTLEYSFCDKKIDLGIATINGRYPDCGYGTHNANAGSICKRRRQPFLLPLRTNQA